MPRPRFATADAQLRQRILDVASREFAAKGYEAASLNRILLEAGLSKGSFYYYFDDKLDLAATVFMEAAKPMMHIGEIRPVNDADAWWAEMYRFSLQRLKDIDMKRTESELVMRLAHAMLDSKPFTEKVMPRFAEGRALIAAFLERGVELGAIRDDIPVNTLMTLLQDVKTSLFKTMYPSDAVPSDAELVSFSELILDMAKRITAPAKGGTP